MSDPLIEIAVEPKHNSDRYKLLRTLAQIAAGDSSLRVMTDVESGQTIIGGMSEPHVAAVVERLKNLSGINANVGAPQVAYRETITRPADIDYTHKKQTGGSGQFARVKMHFEPLPPGSGFSFESKVVGDTVPKEYIPGVEKGVKGSLDNGVLAGFPVIDFKVELTDGAYHEVDSSALAFEIAARAAMNEGLAKASPKLLEPIMKLEVATPLDHARDVLGDLRKRRSVITKQEQRGDTLVIDSTTPLANLFGYARDLAVLIDGRVSFTMAFSHYAPVPPPSPGDRPFPSAIGTRV
jgi:elongation factor G